MSEIRVTSGDRKVVIESDLLTASINLEDGTFDIVGRDGIAVREGEVAVATREVRTSSRGVGFEFGRATRLSDGVEVLLRRKRQDGEPDVGLTITVCDSQPYVLMRVQITNGTASPIRVQSFEPLSGGRIEMAGEPLSWRFYKQGWQSWSPTLVLPCAGEDIVVAPPLHAPATTAEPRDGRFVSELITAIVEPGSNTGVIAGFVTAADQFSQVWFDREGAALSSASYADGLEVAPEGTLASETLYVEPTREPLRSLERYGDVLAPEMHALPAAKAEVASGWCSWYRFWTGVTEEDVVSNLEYLAAHNDELPVRYVQLDDGYQADIGDWLTVNEKFPHGMKWLVDRIHDAGFEAGLWLAPFLIGANSQHYRDHPDWAVQHKPGTPYIAMLNWGQANYALDLSRDQVIEWLHHVFTTVTREWGFDYVKIDFVYAGAVDGIRANEGLTRAQLYRRGLQTIRDAVGDRFILGCGNPIGPSIGLVDGSRIGPDVAPFWHPQKFEPIRQRNAMAEPSALNSIRNTLSRYWMHGRLWQNDPDCLLVRQIDTSMREDEVRSLTTAIAITGGMVLDSDDLSALSVERRDMLSMLLPVYGKPATPLDLFRSDMPQVLELDCGSHRMVALFNWDDEQASVAAPIGGSSHVFDVWDRRYIDAMEGDCALQVPAHGCRLLGVRLAEDYPQVVGSDFHVMQGALEIESERWDGSRLEVSLRPVARKSGALYIHLPAGSRLRAVSGVEADVGELVDGVWCVKFELREPITLALTIA